VAVLGLEAVFALAFAMFLLGERLSPLRLLSAMLIILGVALLRRA
jgi:drug/metabolite transporter (DMT)-like permease